MKINYLSKDVENEDKIPENISIRTMQSDLARLKEIAKRKPEEISEITSKKIPDVDLEKKLTDHFPKKTSEKLNEKKISFDDAGKKQDINITEKKENAVKISLQDKSLKKKKENIAMGDTIGNATNSFGKKPKTKKNSKKIILIIFLIIFLICASLFFYYWFVSENELSFSETKENAEKQEEKKTGIRTIVPKIPFISKFQKPTTPTIQYPFILIEETFSFNFSTEKEFNLISVLEKYLKTLENIPEVALIEIKKDNKILTLEELLQKINIAIPKKIIDDFSKNNYALIFFNLENKYRLGLVFEVDDFKNASKNVNQWETTMVDDLNLLFLETKIGSPATSDFQKNIYQEIEIHYLNFSEPNITIDYAFVNNKLIITTSKENIYKIIDILLNEK